jgi:hypothetical protein
MRFSHFVTMLLLHIRFSRLFSILIFRILFAPLMDVISVSLLACVRPLLKNRVPRILAHKKIKSLKTRHFPILTYIFRRRHVSLYFSVKGSFCHHRKASSCATNSGPSKNPPIENTPLKGS